MNLTKLAIASLVLASTSVMATNAITDKTTQYFKPFAVTNGFPIESERADIEHNLALARASELFIWSMPLNVTYSMRDAGLKFADYLDVAYLSDFADHQFEVTTVNNETLYALVQIDLSKGPVVYEQPAMDKNGYLFGSILNVWQVALTDLGVPKAAPDNGRGGKYLILPPHYKGDIPEGYIIVESNSNFAHLGMRSVMLGKGDKKTAIARIKQMKVYPLANSDHKTKFIDVAGKNYPAENKTGLQAFKYMHEWINSEQIEPINAYMAGLLKHVGIEKGKPFPTDDKTLKLLEDGAKLGYMAAKNLSPTGLEQAAIFKGTAWRTAGQASTWSADYITKTGMLDVDRRIGYFNMACIPPRNMGSSTYYIISERDTAGKSLDGNRLYKLHLDPNVPIASGFWSVIVYDKETSRFIDSQQDKYAISSLAQDIEYNKDGSIDLYFGGSELPKDVSKGNWIPSAGRDFSVGMRFYGPDWNELGKTWTLKDFELIK